MPTRRTTAHATARKAAIALMAHRIIRLLNGGEHRRPSVRPSELARARALRSRWRGTARVYSGPRAARRLGRIPTWLPAVEQFNGRIHPALVQGALKMLSRPLVLQPGPHMLRCNARPKKQWRPSEPHLLRRKAVDRQRDAGQRGLLGLAVGDLDDARPAQAA